MRLLSKKVSIIVPVYKVEAYLSQCVEPLLKQVYKNIELILVDDGSPDSCGTLCDQYAAQDDRVIVIHQSNQGLSAARNSGMRIASGEYFSFIDSDDVVSEHYISCLMQPIEEAGAQLSICRVIDFQDGTQPIFTQSREYCVLDRDAALSDFLYMRRIRTGVVGKLLHRSLCVKNLFRVGIYYEDAEPMYHALCNASRVALCDAALFGYRHRSTGQSKQSFTTKEMDCINVWSRVYDDIQHNHPQLSKPVASRAFSANSHIFFMIPYGENSKETKLIWSLLKRDRRAVLLNPDARKKARAAALLSYFGPKITRRIGGVLLARENIKIFKEQK